ncbi:hypothetical protein BN970_01386 [Mycolicibacterium conceptionense]|uniref:Uncharacterized protein n=1 Tax=Mycolicibacterium conceptionense TaxID=451644 RepID=A0A0U1D3G2_9MYCO|nr:hypothetical protein [Mycolicibacterium conceptionense]ORV20976.1 hypothetical protein AWB98_01375 [Mycolicibacterium conceptionense]CQD07351.1 hypothetical protein BN970_01386 [Mycolicibacterium conceptionense]
MSLYLTNAVAQGMLNGTGLAEALGASPKIRIYSGSVPANADAALSGNTVLAELVCASTPFSGFSDTGTAARATYGSIASDVSADATGTATFFRQLDAAGTTVKYQGTVGTSSADLILNTVAITAGSTVAISTATIDLPEGP